MFLSEKTVTIPAPDNGLSLISYFEKFIDDFLSDDEMPIRFVVTSSDKNSYQCEIGVLSGIEDIPHIECNSIFRFNKRRFENYGKFNAVFIVPTGIGAEIGGQRYCQILWIGHDQAASFLSPSTN